MSIPRKFDTSYPVHIFSRAVEGKGIFSDEEDCLRFIFYAYASNIGRTARNLWRQDIIKAAQTILHGEEVSPKFIIKEHKPLVYFLDFAEVVNHYHFYVVPNFKYAIPILMKNLNNRFAQYFNLKHNRKGTLFDGRYQAVVTKNQFQADAVSRYVSIINPLDVFQPGWREEGLKNPKKAFNFLEDYQFSSFPDKIGERKSKILAPLEILEKYLTISPKKTNDFRGFVDEFLNKRSSSHNHLYLE